jgi:hypothetical protein
VTPQRAPPLRRIDASPRRRAARVTEAPYHRSYSSPLAGTVQNVQVPSLVRTNRTIVNTNSYIQAMPLHDKTNESPKLNMSWDTLPTSPLMHEAYGFSLIVLPGGRRSPSVLLPLDRIAAGAFVPVVGAFVGRWVRTRTGRPARRSLLRSEP